MKSAFAIFSGLVWVTPGTVLAQTTTCWLTEIVDDEEGLGYFSNVLLNAEGQPTVAYSGFEGASSPLQFAVLADSWNIESVAATGVNQAAVMVADPLGIPAIAYCDLNTNSVKLARRTDEAWSIETVASIGNPDFVGEMGLAFNESGHPMVTYPFVNGNTYEAWIAEFDGESWISQKVGSGSSLTGLWTRVVLAPDGTPYVAFNIGFSSIRILRLSDGQWVTDHSLGVGGGVSTFGMAINPSGQPVVAYNDFGQSRLEYAVRDSSGAWTLEVIDSEGGVFLGSNAFVVFDSSGHALISYVGSTTPDELRLATEGEKGWTLETVATVSSSYVLETSVALADDGTRYISYGEGDYSGEGTLWFAHSPSPGDDCNQNGIADGCDIASGESMDANGDGIPDECPPLSCDGDVNSDSVVDPLDAGYILARLGCLTGQGDPSCDAADANLDGLVDPLDVGFVLSRFGKCS